MRKISLSWLMLLSVPFINFGPIVGAKVTFAHLTGVIVLLMLALKGRLRLNHPTIVAGSVFITAITIIIFATVIFTGRIGVLTQLINYIFMFAIMLASYSLARGYNGSRLDFLERYFKTGIVLVLLSIVIFLIGIVNPSVVHKITPIFNNANTFDLGSITAAFYEDLLPRLTGLSPEPSFWSVYIATLIATGLTLRRSITSFSMLLLIVGLILTLSRTGFIAVTFLVLYRMHRRWPNLLFITIPAVIFTTMKLVSVIKIDKFDISTTQRLESIAMGWNAFIISPIFGIGWEGFSQFSKENNLDYPVIYNYYLQIATNGGLFIFTWLMIFLISIYVRTPPAYRDILIVIFTCWATVPAYNLPFIWFLFGVLISIKSHTSKFKSTGVISNPSQTRAVWA